MVSGHYRSLDVTLLVAAAASYMIVVSDIHHHHCKSTAEVEEVEETSC